MELNTYTLIGDDEQQRLQFLYEWSGQLMDGVHLAPRMTKPGQAWVEGRLSGLAFARKVAADTLDSLYPEWRVEKAILEAMLTDKL